MPAGAGVGPTLRGYIEPVTSSASSPVRLLGPAEIRELAGQLGINPTKKLGQNFVHDPNTVRKIVALSGVSGSDRVVEVGPGLGSLTLELLRAVAGVVAIEIDPRLAAHLPHTAATYAPGCADKLQVLAADALHISAADQGAPPTALVANLPYNVSVPVLLHLLLTFPSIDKVLVMVQLEVAERLAAQPGSRVYGVPSVKAGYYGRVEKAATIGKNVFWPAPKIDSGLVRLTRWAPGAQPWSALTAQLEAAGYNEEALRTVVFSLADAAFLQRRKTLRAALSGWFGSAQQAEQALHAAGIDPKERGEKLATADFVRLAAVHLLAGDRR
ncbi:16S rRNA (adenine(1518)-N(6)/adenine(1519)-N(6))-dimethyltransferase [Corynebacterium heidelbergense]|uniref:Ribosomal RNA small subunit methyltransferase A n=1 Tax=Corynebacterium heidelbergense TaxID=2055947 RepID=A0A364V4S7_9CORY|nr:16S rRNA (adenine(1518)-N(6)/adenine(1519)-N(6))-dimethyltransferase [Corynebacterium heidelbergense]